MGDITHTPDIESYVHPTSGPTIDNIDGSSYHHSGDAVEGALLVSACMQHMNIGSTQSFWSACGCFYELVVLFVCVPVIRDLLFGVHVRAPDFGQVQTYLAS